MIDDSHLVVNEDGQISAYIGKDATMFFQARMIYLGLKARKSGIQLARNYTPKRLFKAASSFTGKEYKITEYDDAIEDLKTWLMVMETALPIVLTKRETV